MPKAFPENQEAIEVYLMCHRQMIYAGMGTPVDIDFRAIEFAMEYMGVEEKAKCFNKVVAAARHVIEEGRREENK